MERQSGLSELSVISWVSAFEGCPLSRVPLYTIIRKLQKKFGSWTHEVMLLVKVAKSGGKHSGILGSETSFRCFGVC